MLIPAMVFALILPFAQATSAAEAEYVAQVQAQLRECGITTKPKRLEYEDVLQEYSLTLDEAGLENTNVECLANAPLLDSLTIAFADPGFTALYETTRMARPDVRAALAEMDERQRAWLEERGLLAGMPRLDPAQPLSTWSAAVETHCGAEPGAIFVADDEKRSLTPVGSAGFNDQTMCAFTILTLTMAEQTVPEVLITGTISAE